MRNITKKALAAALSFAMCLGVTAPLASAIQLTQDVNVNTNIQVKRSSSGTYEEQLVLEVTANEGNNVSLDYLAYIDMAPVRAKFTAIKNDATALALATGRTVDLTKIAVNGQFIIKITIPEQYELPLTMVNNKDLFGFRNSTGMSGIYSETTPRTYENNVLTITVDVTNKPYSAFEGDGKTIEDTLFDLYLECPTIAANNLSTGVDYVVEGEVTGYTDITINDPAFVNNKITVTYIFVQDQEVEQTIDKDGDVNLLQATVRLFKGDGGYVPGPSGPSSPSSKVTVKVYGKDDKLIDTITGSTTKADVDLTKYDTNIEGYIFTGWYTDKARTNPVTELTFTANKSMSIYAGYKVDAGSIFDTENHFAYIIGYPDKTVRPENNISREEVVTIFYRLLTDDARNAIFAKTCDYPDVIDGFWSTNAISTLTNGGYIEGYEDGTFAPHAAITRAEFVTIASRFFDQDAVEAATYSDIEGHWAAKYIAVAEDNQWITGDGDGKFRPDDAITRAEAMAIVNRMLNRHVDADHILPVQDWIDNPSSAWYYYEVLEATMSHDYSREQENVAYPETWTELTENRDWTELEK